MLIAIFTILTIITLYFLLLRKEVLLSFKEKILFFTLCFILIEVLVVLFSWFLPTYILLNKPTTEITPVEQLEEIKSATPITLIYNDEQILIIYNDTQIIKATGGLATVSVQKSSYNKIESYRAKWASSTRRLLFGPYIPATYYIVYTTIPSGG